jgi:hypothetical protein
MGTTNAACTRGAPLIERVDRERALKLYAAGCGRAVDGADDPLCKAKSRLAKALGASP